MLSRFLSKLTRASRRRPLAGAVTLVFSLCQLATFAHFASTAHQICWYDGEFCHATLRAFEPISESSKGPALQDSTPGESGASHDHHHCHLSPQARERLVVYHQDLSLVGDEPQLLPPPVQVAVRPAHLLYRLAPKLSPPA
jgi:hypothetical protein